ncbi:hypothetical protein RUM43_008828 [Polyplax serrata]|uniref:Uncharacterized protein n=1 Tax=Polyplax serrata TaxID=468196 RepID=A0AAN8NP42_POLSC
MTNAPAPKRRVSQDGNSGVEETETASLVPPDGGWGWMVVFASFMIHIVNPMQIKLTLFSTTSAQDVAGRRREQLLRSEIDVTPKKLPTESYQ